MKTRITVPIIAIDQENGLKLSATVNIDGAVCSVPLPVFISDKILPGSLPLIIYHLPGGNRKIRLDNRFLLESLYGVYGYLQFKIEDIQRSCYQSVVVVTVTDLYYDFEYSLLMNMFDYTPCLGDIVELEYRIMDDAQCEAVLVLCQPYRHVESVYLSPQTCFAELKDKTLEIWFNKFVDSPLTTNSILMLRQVKECNNLWLLTFASMLKEVMERMEENGEIGRMESLVRGYMRLEVFIRTDARLHARLTGDKRMNVVRKADMEIAYCKSFFKALQFTHPDTVIDYLKGYTGIDFADSLTRCPDYMALSIAMTLHPELIEKCAVDLATFILYGAAVHVELPGLIRLRGILDNYVNRIITELNGKIHLRGELPAADEIYKAFRLLVILLYTAENTGGRLQNVRYSQLCRFGVYAYSIFGGGHEWLPKLLLKKSIEFLYSRPGFKITLQDIVGGDLEPLLDRIGRSRSIPVGKSKTYDDNGTVVFDSNGIRVYPSILTDPTKDISDYKVLYNMLYGRITLCSQVYFGLNGLNDKSIEKASDAWALLYMKRKNTINTSKVRYSNCVRADVTELVFCIDMLSRYCTTDKQRHIYYQFAKQIATIERSTLPIMFDWLLRIMKSKLTGNTIVEIPDEVLTLFPRLRKEWRDSATHTSINE